MNGHNYSTVTTATATVLNYKSTSAFNFNLQRPFQRWRVTKSDDRIRTRSFGAVPEPD